MPSSRSRISGGRPAVRDSLIARSTRSVGGEAELDDHVGEEAAGVPAPARRGQAGSAVVLRLIENASGRLSRARDRPQVWRKVRHLALLLSG